MAVCWEYISMYPLDAISVFSTGMPITLDVHFIWVSDNRCCFYLEEKLGTLDAFFIIKLIFFSFIVLQSFLLKWVIIFTFLPCFLNCSSPFLFSFLLQKTRIKKITKKQELRKLQKTRIKKITKKQELRKTEKLEIKKN